MVMAFFKTAGLFVLTACAEIMGTCPFCQRGSLRIIAAITQAEVIRKMLRHLKLAADPPPLAPARARQATFDWVA